MHRRLIAAAVLTIGLAALCLPVMVAGSMIAGEPAALQGSWTTVLVALAVVGVASVVWSLRTLIRCD